ncbi:MAG: hypothetical protein ACI80V_000867 [Rhodothermales bacterium]|jgi:hypothetical protein
MKTIWREYGLIVFLLVIAIGGYLFVSSSEEDLVAHALATVSEQLLALVPEGDGRERTRASLARFEHRLADNQVSATQMEMLAANVLNLKSHGQHLAPEEAEMVLQMAMDSPQSLPTTAATAPAATAPGGSASPAAPLAVASVRSKRVELEAAAVRVERMFELFTNVWEAAATDSIGSDSTPVVFYVEDGLRMAMDDRLKPIMEDNPRVRRDWDERRVDWKARLGATNRTDIYRLREEARALNELSMTLADTMEAGSNQAKHMSILRQLESHGVIGHPRRDTLEIWIDEQVRRQMEAVRVIVDQGKIPISS